MSGGKQPDYHLHAMNKETDEKARVGAGWKNKDGRISLVLNPFVRLEAGVSLVLNLFPNDKPAPRDFVAEREDNKRKGHDEDGKPTPF